MHENTEPKLTPKQSRFAKAYVKNGGNGAKAAREAGYKSGGGKDGVMAHENLNKPKVKAAVLEETKKALTAADLTPELVKEGLMRESGLDGMGGPEDAQQGGRVRAMELCGKATGGGMFTDKTVTEGPTLGGLELILKLAGDGCPAMAIGAATDLCLIDFQTEQALRDNGHDDLADKIVALIPPVSPKLTDDS